MRRKSCDWSSYQKSFCVIYVKVSFIYAAYAVCRGIAVACDTMSSVWTYGPAKVLTICLTRLSADFSNAICRDMH